MFATYTKDETHDNGTTNTGNRRGPDLLLVESKIDLNLRKERRDSKPEDSKEMEIVSMVNV